MFNRFRIKDFNILNTIVDFMYFLCVLWFIGCCFLLLNIFVIGYERVQCSVSIRIIGLKIRTHNNSDELQNIQLQITGNHKIRVKGFPTCKNCKL